MARVTPREAEELRQRERIRHLEHQVGFLCSAITELVRNAVLTAEPEGLRIMTKAVEGLNAPSEYRPHE